MDQYIRVVGAREHNLKNISLDLPRDRLIVLTGLSGSGKSSLAFDTIYAEGQRRFVESLSSYARQFLGQMEKPDVDKIDGLSPSIAIDQKTTSKNPRSTVGTVTEIYDYLRLLFARVGTPHCPTCGTEIAKQSIDQMVDRVMAEAEGARFLVLAPLVRGRKGEHIKLFEQLRKQGFQRVMVDGDVRDLDETISLNAKQKHNIEVVVDRLVLRPGIESRLASSMETALGMADGLVEVSFVDGESFLFSSQFACPYGHASIGEITPRLFSFNNPYGACPECTGLGQNEAFDIDLVVSHPELSLNDGAIRVAGWNFADRGSWGRCFINALSERYDFSLDTPWQNLDRKIQDIILFGNDGEVLKIDTSSSKYNRGRPYYSDWIGVMNSLEKRYRESSSDDAKETYQEYMVTTPCPSCNGARLKPEALAVTIDGANIDQLVRLQIEDCYERIKNITFPPSITPVAEVISRELKERLSFLVKVGLNYLTLARASATLSGGEAQRIRLATQIGSGLMGVLYILDEPSIGLHQRDNRKLLDTLKHLRDLGNTVIVVEHDEETIWEADHIVDIGPGAGEMGGKIVAEGRPDDIASHPTSLTGKYLSGELEIPVPQKRRKPSGWLKVVGARENNLKNIDIEVPLGVLCLVTGVSGSGKSSLVNGILHKELANVLNKARRQKLSVERIEGVGALDKVIAIDQSPIGRTPRSNPATYTGVFDLIRQLYASTTEARMRGYKPGRFSFNVKGGRCEVCSGDGVKRIEMHFLSDMYVPCEICKGSRYNRETLEVRYKDKNIADILSMTVGEAVRFFQNQPRILAKLETLNDVGLGYIRLGQSSTQLSGGEAQRVKLATELSKRATGKTMYILDEPTTGLHAADVHRLSEILGRLVEGGNSVVVIEHNLDMIKTADYIIDLGPEGGDGGGRLVASGTPEKVSRIDTSYTGQYLHQVLERDRARKRQRSHTNLETDLDRAIKVAEGTRV